jgi:hypothetical protein
VLCVSVTSLRGNDETVSASIDDYVTSVIRTVRDQSSTAHSAPVYDLMQLGNAHSVH